MKKYHYTIILHPRPEEGGYSVIVPALPGCFAQGETIEECLERAKEAIALHIEGLIEEGLPVPGDEHPQVLTVQVQIPRLVVPKLHMRSGSCPSAEWEGRLRGRLAGDSVDETVRMMRGERFDDTEES